MPLETGTYISDLVSTNPASTDATSQGDDHLRLIKAALLATFPSITGAVTATHTALNGAAAIYSGTQVITAPVGAVGAPSYSFLGDTDTGWYHSAADEVALSLGGVLRATWSATGLDLATYTLDLSASSKLTVGGVAVFPVQTADIGDLQVTTGKLAADAVTFAKIQNATAGSVVVGADAAGDFKELTLGTGLSLSGTTISAPAFPPNGAYKNLAIDVATNTTATCSADWITVSDGTNFRTIAFSSATLDFGTNGALNALDTGTVATSTWYAVYAIAKADGSLPGFLASTNYTSPTLPSGYTLYSRVGSLRTAGSAAQLMGTKQRDNKVQYVIGLTHTTGTATRITSGTSGNVNTPTYTSFSLAGFIPTTGIVGRFAVSSGGSGGVVIAAPNSSYGNFDPSAVCPPPLAINAAGNNTSNAGEFVIEDGNIYYAASGGAGNSLWVHGWTEA